MLFIINNNKIYKNLIKGKLREGIVSAGLINEFNIEGLKVLC